ncbi:MAG: hypothetical protein MI784_03550 [Cytophagales bacterium]|nr:hypothetical protein [Cytophagales bacterium]
MFVYRNRCNKPSQSVVQGNGQEVQIKDFRKETLVQRKQQELIQRSGSSGFFSRLKTNWKNRKQYKGIKRSPYYHLAFEPYQNELGGVQEVGMEDDYARYELEKPPQRFSPVNGRGITGNTYNFADRRHEDELDYDDPLYW